MAVQDVIKNRRLELGLTMKDVADYVGVAEGTVSRWESGNIANMKRNNIYLLAKVLGISPLVILVDEDKENPPTASSERELDETLVLLLRRLDDAQVDQVIAFVQGMLVAEGASASGHK